MEIQSGCAYRICQPEEAAPSGMRRWAGQDMPARDPHLVPSVNGACCIPRIVCFSRSGYSKTMGSQWRGRSSLSPKSAKYLTHPGRTSHCTFQWRTHFPVAMGLGCSQQQHPQGESGQWLSPSTSIRSQCWVPQHGSSVWRMGHQALLVNHSNVLNLETVF